MTPDSLYAALDCENADIDLILGQIADWYADHCNQALADSYQYIRKHGLLDTLQATRREMGLAGSYGTRGEVPVAGIDSERMVTT
jgi:hypothetical protein